MSLPYSYSGRKLTGYVLTSLIAGTFGIPVLSQLGERLFRELDNDDILGAQVINIPAQRPAIQPITVRWTNSDWANFFIGLSVEIMNFITKSADSQSLTEIKDRKGFDRFYSTALVSFTDRRPKIRAN